MLLSPHQNKKHEQSHRHAVACWQQQHTLLATSDRDFLHNHVTLTYWPHFLGMAISSHRIHLYNLGCW